MKCVGFERRVERRERKSTSDADVPVKPSRRFAVCRFRRALPFACAADSCSSASAPGSAKAYPKRVGRVMLLLDENLSPGSPRRWLHQLDRAGIMRFISA
jgi:hypothetical protein